MKIIYENQVKALGACVDEFQEAGLFIIFGDNAPDELKDYCYSVSVNPIQGTIAAGQVLKVDDALYRCRLGSAAHAGRLGTLHHQFQRADHGRPAGYDLRGKQADAEALRRYRAANYRRINTGND